MPIGSKQISEAINLLRELIATPSFSRDEEKTADILAGFLKSRGAKVHRKQHNVYSFAQSYVAERPTLLLNSHHDTVKPVDNWIRNPFDPMIENGCLYGLGSNDAGASLVALTTVFLYYSQRMDLPFNLVLLASAEEEISGKMGVESALVEFEKIDLGIVGEPTQMRMAIAEKGLLVLDGVAYGKSGHAARSEGVNALYIALDDINALRNYQFENLSDLLGEVKMSVTQISGGKQHNVVPDSCRFVVDVRTTDRYTNEEVFKRLQQLTKSTLTPRSFRLNSSGIPSDHPLLTVGKKLNIETFGSATLSDQALMSFPTIKMGPGNSNRSHTADEYILLDEITDGIQGYIKLIDGLVTYYKKLNL